MGNQIKTYLFNRMRKSLRRTQRRKQKTKRQRRLQRGGTYSGYILTKWLVMRARRDEYTKLNFSELMSRWINQYFLGKHLEFIKKDSTKVAGVLTAFDRINANGDTYALRVTNNSRKVSTISLDDIIDNVYTKIIISDLDDRSISGVSIVDNPTLSGFVVGEDDL